MRWTAVLAAFTLVLAACAQRSAWTLPVRPVDAEQLAAFAPAGRLPGTARPVAYRAALDIDPRQTRFNGSVEIDIVLEAAATGLWLHGDDLDVSTISATAGGESVPATWTEVLDTGVVWVGFPKRLTARRVTLAIDYSAPFNTSLAGLFKVEAQGSAFALAKSESIEARRFMPGFDEPGFKAVFDMSFTVPEGMAAIANTPEISRETARPGFETIRFAPTRPLSTYLLSAAVGPFEHEPRPAIPRNSVRNFEVPLAGYARAGKGAEMDFVLSETPSMVRVLEEMLQQPYPYEKLDLIAAPQWPSGATELAGAITYRESRILRSANAGPAFVRSLQQLQVHELAHMWFGNLVTPPWWDDLWLKEGFANWAETAVLSVLEPDGLHDVTAVADGLSAMAYDSLASVRAVAGPVGRNEDIRSAYDPITYSKGQAVIRMVDHYFTPERFRPALGRYIRRYTDGAADSDDFFESISRAMDEPDAGAIFKDFVTRQGLPLVEAEVTCGLGNPRLTLRQSRYKPLGSSIDPRQSWTLPVCVSWQDGANRGQTCTLMKAEKVTTEIRGAMCPSAIVPNADGAGYYRFNLQPDAWSALGAAFDSLPPSEALVSLDSAEAGFAAGLLPGGALAGIIEPGLNHPEPTVVLASLRAAQSLLQSLDGEPAAIGLQVRIAAALASRPPDPAGSEAESRILAFRAQTLDEPAARSELLSRLAPLLDGTGGLSSDLYLPALRVAFAEGGEAGFDRILAARERLDDAVFTQAVADAIGSVAEPELARRAEQLALDGTFGGAASYSIINGLMANPQHREETWVLVTARFPEFLDAIPAQSRRSTPRLARAFCDEGRIAELDALFETHGAKAAGHTQALAETREYLALCAVQSAAARAAFRR